MADTFTPEQVSQILEEFFKVVGTRQYIGARYVPIFGRKEETSIQWDNSAPYEPLTIVLYQGNSYTSRQYVPTGIDILNEEFWALTGNYNAQVEAYRQEVMDFNNRLDAVEDSDITQNDQLAGTTDSGLKTLITENNTHLENIDEQLAGTTDSGLKTLINNNADNITQNAARIDEQTMQLAGTNNSGLKDLITNNTNSIAGQAAQLAGTSNSGLKNLIENNTAAITELNSKFIGYAATNVLIFGDSWSDSSAGFPDWRAVAFKDLHYSTIFNYAISGAGWVQGTNNNIEQQINTAIAEMTDDEKDSIADIIVFALINDLKSLSSYADVNAAVNPILSAMQRSYDKLAATYNNARIFFIPTVCGQNYTNASAFMNMCIFNKRMASGSAQGWKVPYNSDFFNCYLQWNDSVIYQTSGLHLSNNGANVIGAAINKMLKGIPISSEMQATQNMTNDDGTLTCNLKMNGVARVITKFTSSQALSQWTSRDFTIPRDDAFNKCLMYMWCSRDSYDYGNGIIVVMQAGSGSIYGSISLSGSATSSKFSVSVTRDGGMNANANIYGVI